MPCPLPQMSVFLLRQGNSVLLLGPHPSFVVYWLFEVPLLTIWVNSVLICSSKYVYSQSKRPMEQMLTGYIYIYAFSRHFYPKATYSAFRLCVFGQYTLLQNQLWSGLFPVEATRRTNAQSVAWPSGLRRCIKAQVSLGLGFKFHRCQGQLFLRLLWLPWPAKSFPRLHSTGFAKMLRGWLCLYFWRVEGWNWARKGQPTLVVWPSGLRRWIRL